MPDSVVALEALALHAVCEMYTKEEGICTSGEEAEAAKANAALHDARGSWLAAMNCLPAVYLSVLKHRARSDQHSDAWEWGRSRPAEVRACMKAARPTEMRQVCVMAPSARRVTALVARKALDDSHEVKRARFKKERTREDRRHQKVMQELKSREDEYEATRQAGAPPASRTAAAPPAAAALPAAAPPAAAPPAAAPAEGSAQRKRPAQNAAARQPPAKKTPAGKKGRGAGMQQAAIDEAAAQAQLRETPQRRLRQRR